MSYATWEDLINRYPSVSRAGGANEISSSFMSFAENEVNGLLSEFYTVPFSSNNVTAIDLAVELSYARIGVNKLSDADKIRSRVMDRIKRLKSGEEAMMLDDGTVLTTIGGTVYSSDANYHHVHSLLPAEEAFVDSDYINTEEDLRGI